MYEGKRVFLSVGALQVPGIKDQLKNGYTVVAYEPEKEAFARYRTVEHKNFFPINKAVSDFNGKVTLQADGGNSSILDTPDKTWIKETYEVEVVSLESVLRKIKKVQVLHLNCEGAEIPILMNTSLDLLERCKRIYVEFHTFRKNLCIADEEVQTCVKRLGQRFKVKDKHTYHPYYEFLGKA